MIHKTLPKIAHHRIVNVQIWEEIGLLLGISFAIGIRWTHWINWWKRAWRMRKIFRLNAKAGNDSMKNNSIINCPIPVDDWHIDGNHYMTTTFRHLYCKLTLLSGLCYTLRLSIARCEECEKFQNVRKILGILLFLSNRRLIDRRTNDFHMNHSYSHSRHCPIWTVQILDSTDSLVDSTKFVYSFNLKAKVCILSFRLLPLLLHSIRRRYQVSNHFRKSKYSEYWTPQNDTFSADVVGVSTGT